MAAGWSWRGGIGSTSGGGWGGSKFNGATAYPSLAGLDHDALRQKARKARWDSPDYLTIKTRIQNSTVNWGLTLEAAPVWSVIDPKNQISPEARKAWKARVQALYGLWMNSTDPDAAGKRTGYQLQGFNFGNKIHEGETFIACRYSSDASLMNPLQLQFINPDQIKNPTDAAMLAAVLARGNTVQDGIEIDPAGREVAIFVWTDPWTYQVAMKAPYVSTCARIPKQGTKSSRLFFLHPHLSDDVGQIRGIPLLAHVVHELQKITDYKVAELEAAVINAIFAVKVVPAPNAGASRALTAAVSRTKVQQADDEADGITRSGIANKPGIAVQTLKAGEDAESFDTKRPNVNYGIFHDCLLEEIATSVGGSLEMVKAKFGQNFSASRGTIAMFWNAVGEWRYGQSADFDNVVYALVMNEWVKAKKIECPGWESVEIRRAWLNCEWIGISAPSIDPQKEAGGADLRIAAGASTREREAVLYNGSNFDDNVAKLTEENAALAEANKPLQPPKPIAPGQPADGGGDGSQDGGGQ